MEKHLDQVNVSDVIDSSSLSRYQMMTIILCGVVVVLDGFDTQTIGFLAPAIADSFGVPIKSFAAVFSAGLFGMMLGALTLGPVADRWGRRWTVIVATLLFGLFSMLTPLATSMEQLVALRFLTGLGLGGAMPNLVSLATEYAPKRQQAMLVAWLFAGIPIGAVVGGLISAVLLPLWGWQSVFYVGGILPLSVTLLLIIHLPESVRFLIARGGDPQKIARIVTRIAPSMPIGPSTHFVSTSPTLKGLPMRHLFTEGRALGTVLLWIPYFMNLLLIYFVVSWLPAVLRQVNMPISAGVTAITLFSIGGAIGCLVTGRLLGTFGTRGVVFIEFCSAMILICALAFSPGSFWLIMTVVGLLGFVVQGAQSCMNALVAAFYPTAIRSTGVGWALGVGRLGSIVGPLLGGLLLSLEWSAHEIFLAAAVPALCAAAAIGISLLRGPAIVAASS
ncbi:MAG: MFS transporter [Alphaproteobacteria bacterium]